MRQKIIYIFIILFVLLGLNLIISNNSYATIASGTVGKYNCPWEITDDGTLIIYEGTIEIPQEKFEKTYLATNDKVWPWNSNSHVIKKVQIDKKVVCKGSLSNMFQGFKITSLDLANLDTSNVTDMSYMFGGDMSLEYLNLDNLDTSNVTNMQGMFEYCKSLTTLDLSSFDTRNVTNMSAMFDYCFGLTNLNIKNFNTANVTNMLLMFDRCESLSNLDLSNFNTSNVINMAAMFQDCYSLKNINLTSFDTSNVTTMHGMFSGCKSLITLDLSNFNTSNVTIMNSMFLNCNSLENINLSSFNTKNVTDMTIMFYNCYSLSALDLRSFDISKVTDMSEMFANVDFEDHYELVNECPKEDLSKYCGTTEPKLKTILVSDKWKINENCETEGMFANQFNLVGANGTIYNVNYIDGKYANFDNNENKGYLTLCYDIIVNNQENIDNINSKVIVNYGNSQDIVLTPNLGYEITKIVDNDNEIEVNTKDTYTYSIENVDEEHNINVETKAIDYKIISGDNQERTENKTENLTIKSDGLFEIFTGLEINGVELVKDKDYTVEKGSTIITLSKEYLDTLDKGEYKIKFKYSNGSEPVGTMKIVDVASVNSNQNSSSNSSSEQVENKASNVISKALYTGDSILKITVPIILVIIVLNIMQVKLQKTRNKNRKPRIGRK